MVGWIRALVAPRAELDAARAGSGQCSMSCAVTLARRNLRALPKLQFHCLCGSGRKGKYVGLSWLCSLRTSVGALLVNCWFREKISLGKHCDVYTVCGRRREWNLGVTWP